MSGALLLDCDGVIVDSEALNLRAWEAATGRSATGTATLAGLDLDAIFACFYGDGAAALGPAERQAILERKHARYAELAAEGLPLVPGIAALVAEARALGWRVAIVSGAAPARLDANLRATGFAARVDLVLGGAKRWAEAARLLGVAPAACVALDDVATGVATARAQGVGRVVGLGGGIAMLAAGAHEVVSRPDDLGLA